MILIFSEECDVSTDHTVEWLQAWKIPFIRINKEETNVISNISIHASKVSIEFKRKKIKLTDITAIWYRRGDFRYAYQFDEISNKSDSVKRQIRQHVIQESKTISEFIHGLLYNIRTIGNPKQYSINKLSMLVLAAQCGLRTPETLVTSDYLSLNNFLTQFSCIISKPLNNPIDIQINNKIQAIGTRSIQKLQTKFFYSLFQQRINRFCEIRVFFIGERIFSMAIFVDRDSEDGRSLCLPEMYKTKLYVNTNNIYELLDNKISNLYYKSKQQLCQKCINCPLSKICAGGYLINRFSKSNGFDNPSIYCRSLAYFIVHVQNYVAEYTNVRIDTHDKIDPLNLNDVLKYCNDKTYAPTYDLQIF